MKHHHAMALTDHYRDQIDQIVGRAGVLSDSRRGHLRRLIEKLLRRAVEDSYCKAELEEQTRISGDLFNLLQKVRDDARDVEARLRDAEERLIFLSRPTGADENDFYER